jgi:hypothetical protein
MDGEIIADSGNLVKVLILLLLAHHNLQTDHSIQISGLAAAAAVAAAAEPAAMGRLSATTTVPPAASACEQQQCWSARVLELGAAAAEPVGDGGAAATVEPAAAVPGL